jgi:hypothetical protein
MAGEPAGLETRRTLAPVVSRVDRRTGARLCKRGQLPPLLKLGSSNRWRAGGPFGEWAGRALAGAQRLLKLAGQAPAWASSWETRCCRSATRRSRSQQAVQAGAAIPPLYGKGADLTAGAKLAKGLPGGESLIKYGTALPARAGPAPPHRAVADADA